MMRSGSNFIERQLNLLKDIRCHGELFNPAFTGFCHEFGKSYQGFAREDIKSRNADELNFIRKIDKACDRDIMGFRLFLDHSPAITARVLYDPTIQKVVLSRNLLEAFVSLQLARDSGVWLTTEVRSVESKPVKFQTEKLITFALRQSLYYNDILTILHDTGQNYIQLDYQDIKQLDRLNDIAAFIGSENRFASVVEPIKKQNPGHVSERIEGFEKVAEDLRKRALARWFL
jgi:hypothetical protein